MQGNPIRFVASNVFIFVSFVSRSQFEAHTAHPNICISTLSTYRYILIFFLYLLLKSFELSTYFRNVLMIAAMRRAQRSLEVLSEAKNIEKDATVCFAL